jgi:tetratricopeptide (TPR) repeat protein
VRLADVTDLQVEGRTPPADSPAVTERLAGWAAVREGSTDPFVDMLFLVSMRTLLPEGRLAVELSRAREAHPELAIFGLLRSRLQEDLLDFDQQRAVLDEVHIAFPSVTAIQVDRARLLLRGGEQDAAREALQHAVRLQPDAFEPTALLADLAAGAGDEAARMRHLVTVLSDTTPASQQREFLLQHGETMASLGCPREATRIWTADLTMPADLTAALRVAAGVRRSRVAVLLHDAPDAAAAQTGAARALLPRGAGSLAQREAWEAELVYDDGVRAMRTGVSGAYEAALSVLSSSASSPDAPRRTHELAALLALEGALGVREPDLSTLDAALQTHRPALAGYCSMHWIDARAAELRGDLAALTRAATAIGSGACRGRVLERGVYTAETHARLASVAAEAGEAARAAEAIAAFHAHWPAPEGDVPLVATMEALQPSSR